jgi:hypothetical protein
LDIDRGVDSQLEAFMNCKDVNMISVTPENAIIIAVEALPWNSRLLLEICKEEN